MYFGSSILAMGKTIEMGMIAGFVGRVSLMSLGLMTFEMLLYFGLEPREVLKTLNILSGQMIEAGSEAQWRLVWLLAFIFAVHFIAIFAIGYKTFFKNLDGDAVAAELFEEVNHAAH